MPADHTPAPWQLGRDRQGKLHIPYTVWHGGRNAFDPNANKICEVNGDFGNGDTVEDAANAVLIAAAPALLRAAECPTNGGGHPHKFADGGYCACGISWVDVCNIIAGAKAQP